MRERGEMNFVKRSAVFAGIATIVIALTGCSGNQDAPELTAPDTVTIDYNGNPLDCVTWPGSHGEVGRTCDFVAYHTNYPDAVFDDSTENVVTVEYKGNPLHCITWWGSHIETGMSCDYVEYNANF